MFKLDEAVLISSRVHSEEYLYSLKSEEFARHGWPGDSSSLSFHSSSELTRLTLAPGDENVLV